MNDKLLLGVTGNIASGKSYACKMFMNISKKKGINIEVLNVDLIRRDILIHSKLKKHYFLRKKLIKVLDLKNQAGKIDGEELGKKIFFLESSMNKYKEIVNPEIIRILKRKIANLQGIVIVEWAQLIEDEMLPLVDFNVLLIYCSKMIQKNRLSDVDISSGQMKKRIAYQGDYQVLKSKIASLQKKNKKVVFFEMDTSKNPSIGKYQKLFENITNSIDHE